MRLVIDSNVWISALVFGGQPRSLLEAIVRGGHTVVLSAEITTEVRRILHAKFPSFVGDFNDLLAVISPRLEHVELGSLQVKLCRDPDDDRVIETACIGGAKFIISGDKDLLSLEKYGQIIICTPSEGLKALA